MTAWVIMVEPAPLPVTVTCCGVNQLALLKLSSPLTVARAALWLLGVIVTVPPGSLFSTTV
ncbi:MAG: hypothetical protein OXF39_09990 [Nitrospira sp.]|nr:hypothetical protein [Nitrospira sp.]